MICALHGGPALILWRCPPQSVRGLRLIEFVAIGSWIILPLLLGVDPAVYGRLERLSDEPVEICNAFVGRHIIAGSLYALKILVYATLIPNRWQRCATVVDVMAVSPLALACTPPGGDCDLR